MHYKAVMFGLAVLVSQAFAGIGWAQEPIEGAPPVDGSGLDEAAQPPATDLPEPEEYEVLSLRLSGELDPLQRDAVKAVIDSLPTVAIGAQATHAITPHPSLSELLVLHEIQGADAVKHYALDGQFSRDGAMPLAAVYEYYASDYRSEHAWASNVPLPTELGDIEQSGFAEHLRDRLMVLARRSALLQMARWNSSRQISVCVSNELPPAGFCPLPQGGTRWNEVTESKPIYISVETSKALSQFVSIVAINRAGDVRHVMTGQAAPYSSGPPPIVGVMPPDQAVSDPTWIFAPDIPLNDALPPGHHDLLILTSERPVPTTLWDQALTGTISDATCAEQFESGICRAMQGMTGRLALDGARDIATVSIGVRGYVPNVRRIVKGSPASLAVSRWQAQLLRYRKIELNSRTPSGRTRFSFKQSHKCGGAYIGDGFVLTAAHCIPDDVSEMRVRLGSRNIGHGGTTFKVRSLVRHKNGNSGEGRVDLAVIQLKATTEELEELGSALRSVSPSTNRNPRFASTSGLVVTGWGFQKARLPGQKGWLSSDGSRQTQPDKLSQLLLVQADMSECEARTEYSAYRARDMLCLRSAVDGGDSCSGDSGGPVTSRASGGRRLVGIVSRGIGCAYKNLPAVYVNVAQHTRWIERAKQKMRTSRAGYYDLN